MNIKKNIGTVMALAGLTLAICTADNCNHELAIRFVGVAMLAIGAWLAEAYDFQNHDHDTRDRRKGNDPYPEEVAERPVG